MCEQRRLTYHKIVGDSLRISINCTANPPATYQWFKNGVLVPQQTSSTFFEAKLDVDSSGTYSCDVHNLVGSVTWLEASVSVFLERTGAGTGPGMAPQKRPAKKHQHHGLT